VRKRSLAVLAALVVPVSVTAIRAPTAVGPKHFSIASEAASVDTTLLARQRTKTAGCTLGPLPDRGCSPGALDARRTTPVICSKRFHTGDVRSVPDSLKHQVEVEYGLAPKRYGSTLEIDHIISLELGGSNDIANLYPELAPGYHMKDVLENRLHKLVCSGAMTLHTAQRRIAADWTTLYEKVFGTKPVTAGSMHRKP
jgi:hypothetical protein